MCFNATASFAASGGLAVVGVASWRLATKPQRALAVVPLIFAVQQAIEGAQWLAADAGTTCTPAGYGFLLIAFLVWPIFLPFAVYLLDGERRWLMKWFLIGGAATGMYLLVMLVLQPLVIQVVAHSIRYQLDVPFSRQAIAAYVLATCGTLLFSSKQYVRWLGALVLAAGIAAAGYFNATSISVWCFFAAVVSAAICFFLWHENRTDAAHP